MMKATLYTFALALCLSLSAEQPNVIYINIDDLGWTDLSYQGSQFYESPNIDKLAASGMTFSNAYAPASNCAPSRASALTGQNTPRHGVYTVATSERGKSKDRKLIPIKNTTSISEDNLTLGHLFKNAGYVTASMGKWHVSESPLKHGFDINIAGTHQGGPYRGGYLAPYKYPNIQSDKKGQHLCDQLTDKAISFIKENKEKKFFLYLPYFSVHAPIQAKKEVTEYFKTKSANKAHFDPKYAAMVKTLDDNIGRLIDALDKNGLRQNTLVIFTSDNGGVWLFSRQWPLRAGKGAYYEGGIREPLIISWPHKIKAASKSKAIVSALDFFPTLSSAIGYEIPEKELDGIDIMPILTGQKTVLKRTLYWHFPIYLEAHGKSKETTDPKFRTRPGSALRHGRWKLHHYFENNSYELYDLENDLAEQKNLAQEKPDVLQKLKSKLDQWRQKMNAPIPTQLNPDYKE